MSIAIEALELEKEYGLGQLSVHALKNINIKISTGEFTAIIGPSGSGKTTLLNILGTLDKPTRGKIFIEQHDISALKEKNIVKVRRRKIGFVFQFYNLMPALTAFENIELPMIVNGVPKKKSQERANALLAAVGLTERAHHRPDQLSGGQQQRIAIARALANKPTIILADEPTGDLDTTTGEQIMRILYNLSKEQGTTVIVTTHDLSILKLADRVLKMKDGQIISDEKMR